MKQIIFLMITSSLSALGYIFAFSNDSDLVCTLAAFWTNFFEFSTIMWIMIISANFYRQIVKRKYVRYSPIWHVVWLFSLVGKKIIYFYLF